MARILLVEDESGLNQLLTEVLELKGYEVASCNNGQEGLNSFKAFAPDLVITDMVMPEVDGVEFLCRIKKDQRTMPCKVIAMSGGNRGGKHDYLAIASGLAVDAVLAKPFEFEELSRCVKELTG